MNNHDGKPFTHIPIWWVGLVMMLGGEVGNFFAYGWAPATVVSPLGAVAVISNCVLARVFLKETITVRNLVGCLFAIVGAIGIAFTAPTSILITTAGNSTVVEEPGSRRAGGGGAVSGEYIYESLVSWRSLGFLIGVLVASAFLANPCEWKRAVSAELRGRYVVCNVLMCGLLGCISVMSAKGVATAFTQMLKGDFVLWVGPHCWLTWILIISAIGSIVGQVQFLNRAMMAFGASEVVPVYFVIFTLSTVTAGMVLYLELNFGTWWRGLLFVLGILCTFFGVSLINQRKNKDGAKEKEEEDEVDHNGVLEPLSGERGESRVGLVPRGRKSRMTPISEGLSGDGWGSGNVEGDNEDLEQPPNGLKEGDVDVSLTSDSESRAELPPSQTGARSPSVELATTPRSAHSSEHSISINSDMVAPRGTNTPRMHHSTQNTPRKDARMLDADAPAPPRLSADHAREPGLDANVPGPHRPSIDHGVAMIPLFDIARAVEYLRRQSTSPPLSSIITSPTLSVAISNDKVPRAALWRPLPAHFRF
jgi:magnesium transporter